MKLVMKRIILSAIVLNLITVNTSSSWAGYVFTIENHGEAIAGSNIERGNDVFADYSNGGLTNGVLVSASARAGLGVLNDLDLGAMSLGTSFGPNRAYPMPAESHWTDVFNLTAPIGSDLPSLVRFEFGVHGILETDTNTSIPNISRSLAGIIAILRSRSSASQPGITESASAQVLGGLASSSIAGWDSVSLEPLGAGAYRFGGTLSIIAELNTTDSRLPNGVGELELNSVLKTSVDARAFGSALSDFSSTMTLNAVTAADGSSLGDGFAYAFESGLQARIPAVPEPSTLTLLAIGLPLGLRFAYKRRERAGT